VVKPGSNELEVEVRATAGGRGGFEGPPPAAAPGTPAAGGRGGRGQGAAAYGSVGGGGSRGGGTPSVSGLLGPVRLVAR